MWNPPVSQIQIEEKAIKREKWVLLSLLFSKSEELKGSAKKI